MLAAVNFISMANIAFQKIDSSILWAVFILWVFKLYTYSDLLAFPRYVYSYSLHRVCRSARYLKGFETSKWILIFTFSWPLGTNVLYNETSCDRSLIIHLQPFIVFLLSTLIIVIISLVKRMQ